MDTDKYPINWRELVPSEYPRHLPRDIYQLDATGDPWNTMCCAEDIAELIWPGSAGTEWALSPTWAPPAPVEPAPAPTSDPAHLAAPK